MNAELKRFDEAVKSDPNMQEEIKSAVKDNQGLVSFANERGYNFTLDDLNGAASELNPEDLDQVSGGAGAPPAVVIVIVAPMVFVI
ncbi:MAG: Nif11-like leader peptide family natural product precursor [Planctomycetota bacterium]